MFIQISLRAIDIIIPETRNPNKPKSFKKANVEMLVNAGKFQAV